MVTANNTERRSLFVAIIALSLCSHVYAQRPRLAMPAAAAATRPPVILLNGWQALCTTTGSTLADSVNTFGQLASLLQADGAVVGFFNTCPSGDVSIEALAAQFGKYLSTLTYSDGTPVTQVDVVAHSMGGLIARAYLAGLQPDGSLLPPANPRIRKLVLIATPNFGITQAIYAGVQGPEMIPGTVFLWNLARWNQAGDDLRGVDALAIIGNAGTWSSVGGAVNGASDGVVSLSSASLGFTKADASRTRIVPYCHTDPTFANTIAMVCSSAGGIANVTSASHYTGRIVRSFLAGTSNWKSIGGTPATDTFLSQYGGMFFAWVNSANQYVQDVSQVVWGPVALQMGGASGAIFYNEFVKGRDTFQATSQSLGTVNCGTFTEPAGYYSAVRCKFFPIISNVRPLLASASGKVVSSGGTITVNGSGFGQQCSACKVLASGSALQVSSWSDTAISATLPATYTGLVGIAVNTASGSDSINIMAAPPVANPTALVNGASFQPGFASAAWVSIFGTNLSQTTREWRGSDFVNGLLPTSLDGVSATINGLAAYVGYVSPTQINVLAPGDATTGTVQVQVTTAQGKSNTLSAQKQQFAPAFFTMGGSYVAAVHLNGMLVGKAGLLPGVVTQPVQPGETVQLYGTGFGPTNPAVPTDKLVTTPAVLANSVQVTIGGATATVGWAGLVEAGLYQLDVTVPDLPDGDASVVAAIGGVQTQTGVAITVQH